MAEHVSISFLKAATNTSVADDSRTATELLTPPAGTTVSTVESTSDLCILRLVSTQNILASIGPSPNAETDSGRFLLPAGQIEWRAVRPGHKVAVVLA